MERAERSPFRPSVLYAGIEIARECSRSGRAPMESLSYIRQGSADRTSFDYPVAAEIACMYSWRVFSDHSNVKLAFRATLKHLIEAIRPLWIRLLPSGRAKVLRILDADLQQCIHIAGLLSSDHASVAWWDAVTVLGREWGYEERLRIGRVAERRAMARERILLKETKMQPIWVAVDDNAAGYDIKSWRPELLHCRNPVERYIEVKATSPLGTVHITRREWQFAETHPDQWELQIWLNKSGTPMVLKVNDLSQHIALNQGSGSWSEIAIPSEVLLSPISASCSQHQDKLGGHSDF